MKVRKLAVALALAGGLGSGVAQALGLGEIELQSYLNEPLDAEITLRKSEGVDPGDVFVDIASESAYERVGIDRNYFLTKLDFEVTTASDGSLVVNVSSREPLREPYLNFLLEVTWPNGRLMREYAVLVDPPVYAEDSGVEEEVAAPATREAAQPSQQQDEPRSQAREQEPQRASSQRPRTLDPTKASDTLWNIAASVRPDSSVSMQQVMLALQDLNPDAFMGGNINRLKRGEVLRVPDMEDIRSRSRAEANRLVAAQNEEFSSPERTVDATDEGADADVASGQAGEGATSGDELRLLASEDTGSRDADEGGSAGGDGDTEGGVDAGSAVAMEELESARRENEELSGRVDDLQEQVETLQRLLELKNTQLAEIQQTEGEEAGGDQPADAADEETLSDEVAEEDVDAGDEADTEADVAAADAESDDASESEMGQGEDDTASGEEETVAEDDAAETAVEEDSGTADEDLAADESETAVASEDDEDREEEAEAAAPSAEQPSQEPSTPPAQPDKGFPDNIISAITNNPTYQIALGGGLVVLLLLLLLLARRNANREKEFYDQLNGETEGETDSFDLTLDDEEVGEGPDGDPLAEADAYIAYGRMDQAAQSLETAISREPSRSDLRLKLLGVYADTQDRASFEKQLREVEALEDEQAIAEAHQLRSRLEEAESMPSIDDLESQLRSDSFDTGSESTTETAGTQEEDSLSDEFASDRYESRPEEEDEDEFGSLETDFSELDLDEQEEAEAARESGPDDMIEYDLSDIGSPEDDSAEANAEDTLSESDTDELTDDAFDFTLEDESSKEGDDDDLSLELDDLETDTEASAAKEAAGAEDEADEFASLELDEADLESPEPETAETGDAEPEEAYRQEGDLDSLDESFLDELDAELDKVASDDEVSTGSDEDELEDLELDVSDEDLALMEEFADSGDSAGTDAEDDSAPLDKELGLEDALSGEEPASPEETVAGAEAVEDELPDLGDETEEEPPVASDAAAGASRSADIDESELGDDDDFDFLSGTDEASTKLDLARAYVEMGDVDGARDILEEVALEGNEEQKAEAQDLLKNLS
ncbi:FimV/HubP family polar landmark protein [Marinobacter sp. HL-58]|uniref:FimV/HubP family polar landmark protein n=1 Tax=Marinobacter sp. HL-58 TaxID=1479237 RepID=UPI000480626A|nr:FimV/HubP family polar landmark protein [Marinobacter sp. HL-58]KPQ01441.1 MAG: pilus assembly protein FimV [Marinobacter sp. HL-58]